MSKPADRSHRVCAWLTTEEFARISAIRTALKLTVHDMLLLTVYRFERILREERQRQHP